MTSLIRLLIVAIPTLGGCQETHPGQAADWSPAACEREVWRYTLLLARCGVAHVRSQGVSLHAFLLLARCGVAVLVLAGCGGAPFLPAGCGACCCVTRGGGWY